MPVRSDLKIAPVFLDGHYFLFPFGYDLFELLSLILYALNGYNNPTIVLFFYVFSCQENYDWRIRQSHEKRSLLFRGFLKPRARPGGGS